MAGDNELIITAELDTATTISNIQGQLKDTVQPALQGILQVDCSIKSDSISAMKNQLSEITKGITLDVSKIQVADVNTAVVEQNISKSLSNISPQVQITPKIKTKVLKTDVKEIRKQLDLFSVGDDKKTQNILQEYFDAFQSLDPSATMSKLREFQKIVIETTKAYELGVDTIKQAKADIRAKISDGSKIFIDEPFLHNVASEFGYQRPSSYNIQSDSQKKANQKAINEALNVFRSIAGGANKITTKKGTAAVPFDVAFEGNGHFDISDASSIIKTADFLRSSPQTETVRYIADLETIYETINKILNLPTNRYEFGLGGEELWLNVDNLNESNNQISSLANNINSLNQAEQQVSSTDLLNSIPQQFADTADVTDKVTQKFLGLKDVVSKVSITDITAPNGQIESFTAKVTESTGAVRDFKYSLEDVGNGIMAFNLKSTKGNNVGIEKQLQQNAKVVDDYTSKVNNLKAQMGEDFTKGFSSSFESFSSTLNNFKNGTATVEEVRHSFIILENEIKTAKSLLRGGDKSLNEFDNARTSARDLDRTLIQIQTDFKNLSDTRKTGELSRSINDIETKMQSLKDIEKKDGFSNEWVKKYAELKITLRDVQSEIKLAKKLEQEDASSGLKRTQTLLKEINDSYRELIKNTKLYYKNGISEKEANTYSTRGVNAIDKFNNAKVSLIREGLYTPEIKERIKVLEENHSILKENLKTEKEYALVLEEENKQIAQLDKEQRIRKLTSKQSNLTDSLNNLQTTDKSKIQQDLNTAQDKINSLNKFSVNSVQWKQTYGEIDELFQKIKYSINEVSQAEKAQQQESIQRINQQIQAFENAEKKKTEYYKLWKNPNSNEELQNAKEQYEKYSADSKQAESLLKNDLAYTDSVEKRIQAIKQEQVEERIKFNAHVEGAKRIKAENEQLKEEESRYKEISKLIADYTKKLQAFNSSTTAKNNSSNENVQSQVAINQNLITQLSAMSESLGKDKSATNVANLKTQLDTLTTSLEQATADSINLENALKDNRAEETKESKLRNLQSQLKSFANTNQRAVTSLKTMSNGGTFAGEYQRLVEMASRTDLDKNGIAKLTEDFRNFKAEAKASGLTAERFFSGMGNQLRMITSRWFSLYAIIGKIKSMIDNVKSLDTAMVSLKRVTTGTSEEYQKFLETAQISARNTYSSWSDTVEQASRWAKAGYSLEESAELAKTSLIYSKVGDVDNTTAVSDLVTVLRGFNMEATNSLSIVDKLDILNNKYATDAKSLGEALTVSSSAMATAGNSLDQTLAMITGGTEITQNAKEMGTALRTISMRIRSMKGQLEELGEEYENVESVSKIQTQILNLTKGKVNIFDSNNNFRSTYDILKDISEIYETLSDPDKATLSEILFGKTRGNQGLALINAFRSGQIGKAFTDAVNSAGTATDEMDAYAKGMEAHISSFKERIEELSGAMFKSNGLKFYIDLGTQLISILTEATKHIGLFGTAVTAVVGAMTFKGVNPIAWWKEYSSIPKISEADAGALRQYNNLLSQGTEQAQARSVALANSSHAAKQLAISANGAAVSENTLSAATNKLTISQRVLASAATIAKTALLSIGTMAIMAGITAVINWFSKTISKAREAKLATEESREDAVQTAKAYEEEANKLSGVYSKYINLVSSTRDLSAAKEELKNIQQEVNDSYDNEAKKIDLVNGNIAENIRLLREQQKVNAEKQVKESQGRAEVAEQNLQKETTYKFNATGLGSILFDAKGALAKAILDNDIDVDKYTQYNEEIIKSSGFTDFYITGTLKKQIDVLTQIRDIYADIDGHSAERLNQLDSEISKLQTEYDQEKKIVDQHKADVANAESFANPEIAKGITDITEKYQDFQSAIEKGDINKAFDLKDEIESTKDSLVAMSEIGSNDRDTILGLFDSLDLSMEKAKSSLAISTQEIQKYIDDSFGSSFEQLDKIDKAVQSLTDGDLISSSDAWNLMDKIDSDGILKDIEVIGGKYKMSTQELISLRNKLIDQQLEILKNDKEEAKTSLKSREQDLRVMGEKIKQLKDSGINNAGDQTLLNNLMNQYDIISDEIAQAKVKIVENEYAQQEFNDRLNVTLDLTKAIKAETDAINKKVKALNDEISTLETEMENYLKAQEYVVDSIVKKKEKEKKILENEKTALEEQLSALEKQKENIEQIVSKYDTASSAVTGAIKSQIEELENSRQSVEDYYDSMIEKLREENDERESAVEYAEKLANLENAKNNKVKTYSSARGWEWIADKSAVQDAQNNLDSFVNEQKISQLEKEKEQALTPYNQQISDLEKYEEEWSKVADSVKQAQDEIIASEMFGADWHEKILNKDIQLLETYRSEYSTYSNELNTLDTVDIADLQEQIKLKEEQISAIDKSIQGWNDYKTEIQDSATAIKETLESYMAYVNTVAIDENSSYEQRMANLANFTQNYSSKISELTAKKQEVKDLEDELQKLENTNTELILETEGAVRQLSEETEEIDTKSKTIIGRAWETIKELGEKYAKAIDVANEESNIKLDTANKVSDSADKSTENLKDGASHIESAFDSAQKASDTIKQTLDDTGTDFQYKIKVTSDDLVQSANEIIESLDRVSASSDVVKNAIDGVLKLAGYSNGGVDTSTGLAMLHGTPNSPEVVFNAKDAVKLYNLVHDTSNLSAEVAERMSVSNGMTTASGIRTGNTIFNFTGDIKTDNPITFMGQLKNVLDEYMDNYWITKLSESRVR